MADLDAEELNPHYWLAAYGVRSELFCWMVAHGALNDYGPSRAPVHSDVPIWNRSTKRLLPTRHQLKRKRVLK